MTCHREAWKASHILPMALLAAGVFSQSCYGQTGTGSGSEDPRAQVNRVLLALPNVEFPAAGRGTALVMWDTAGDKPADRPRFVEFAFKGPMSRSDVFAFAAGKKGPWLYSHAITDRFAFGVNAGGARISYHPRHNQLGEDFHPAVFLSYPEETSLDERLRRYLNSEVDLVAEVDAEGILQLVHRWDSKDADNPNDTADRLSFDTRRGYLPVLLSWDSNYPKQEERSWHWTIKFEWAKFGSGWYISSAQRLGYTGALPDAQRPWQITITAFDPNAEISDEEFTMEGLGAQEGMTVVEAGSGFSHVYSPPATTPIEWKEISEETEPTSNAQEQESAPALTEFDPTGDQTFSEQAETADPARAAGIYRTPALASDGVPGTREKLAEPTASAERQPGKTVRTTLPLADKAQAAEADHLAASPHRVIRVHTLLALFLLAGLFVAVECTHGHARAHHRQQREP